MRYLLSLIIALATLLPSLAQAYDVLILQSRRDPAYEEVLKGFRSQRRLSERLLVLSDYGEVDIARIVREDQPGLVLTLGDNALALTRKLHQTPVLALMSLNVHNLKGNDNITGIGMYASVERYMKCFQNMKVRRVGVILNPAKSGWYLKEARQAAQHAGIELVVREVNDPRDSIAKLDTLAGKVDGIWMLPDTTAVTRGSAEAYFNFAMSEKVPLVSFAGGYLGLGAAAVVEIDRDELGIQASAMAISLLRSKQISSIPKPAKTIIKVNQSVLKHLGISAKLLEANAN